MLCRQAEKEFFMYTVSIFIAMFAALSGDDPPVFTVSADTVPIRISVGAGADALVSPEEGLWSIASGWEQGWPTRCRVRN